MPYATIFLATLSEIGTFSVNLQHKINIDQVNYIDFNMNTLDMAYNVHRPKKKPKKDKALKGNKRAKEDLFYT